MVYFLKDSFNLCVQRFKVRYCPTDVDVLLTLTEEDKTVKLMMERVRAAIKFICDNPVYRLRIYQKHLAREGIILMIPLIVGAEDFMQHKVRLLDDLNIDKFSEILFSVTGRRFGKTILLSLFVTAVLLYSVKTVRPFTVGVFAITLEASIRLLEEVTTVLKQCQYMFQDLYTLDESQKKVVLINKLDSSDIRRCLAFCGAGKSTRGNTNDCRRCTYKQIKKVG